ncbi:28S ribosomal protein S18c, mitochondrial [Nilaparvata lugens]|uniref:28S ribosomal protein S18c, mitochondrial n=1 Tax=Nilaparvata lugens TaxID=108931 RepID=UPI000B98CC76|nr:28S ribosomal protein S18c, mitochondrial [Nilaparvata lugens]XP_039297525.1 28S ribosomal protein S18c, mitochondrial [Nilaparvata lugens]XP_039297533.1 28S ribosomal protein S18c, mitochondrial [Nilaparvata lugens]
MMQNLRAPILSFGKLLGSIRSVQPPVVSFKTAQALQCSRTEVNLDLPVEIENPFQKDKRQCILCKMNIIPNYKNVKLLSQFVSPYTGYVYGRHITGLCRKKQELVEREIKKSQSAGLMAIALKELVFMRDPKLFDPDRPFRPHKY